MCKNCDIRVKFMDWSENELENKVPETKREISGMEHRLSRLNDDVVRLKRIIAEEQTFLGELEFEINSRKGTNPPPPAKVIAG